MYGMEGRWGCVGKVMFMPRPGFGVPFSNVDVWRVGEET